jgi:hypothetical protein
MHAIRAGFNEPPVSSSTDSYLPGKDTKPSSHDRNERNGQYDGRSTNNTASSSSSWTTSCLMTLLTMLRWILLDSPYFILVLSYVMSRIALHYHDDYIVPQLPLLEWNKTRATREVTYYKRLCTTADQTTYQPRDLIIDADTMTDTEMVNSMLQHGISVLPNLMSLETARLLRETIIKYNTMEENFGVLSNKHRYSYGIRMEQDPIVRTAVREISTHPSLQKLLPPLIGDDPALYKFHAITSAYGAADQHYHWDVMASSSAVGYSRSFAPLYSLFIPLQHTPVAMCPTQICPGSHVCSAGTNFCNQTAFQILLNDIPNTTEPVWPATYGALMNQQLTHRGRAHTFENGPDRVLFILAITPRPRSTEHVSTLETRSLSLGGSYAIHWTQWGHTWSDLYRDTMYNPVKTLRSLGWYKPRGSHWGRDWLMTALLQLANGDYWSRSYLETYIKEGGLSYIPKIFHFDLPDSYKTEVEEDLVWYHFFVGTFRNVIRWIPVVVITAFLLYTFLYSWVQLVVAVLQRQGFAPVQGNFRAYGFRMLLLHGLAFGIGQLLRDHIDGRPWSRHIQQRKMYTLPTTFPSHPDLPSTLPVPHDVLMLDDFQSDYLASYTRLYDVGHPGNARWKIRLAGHVGDDRRYPDLPAPVQDALQESLVQQVETEGLGRFLTKNRLNQWARMTKQAAKSFVHKELLRASRKALDVLLREIAYRRSETKFGPWRHTALHRHHIPQLLSALEKRLGAVPRPVTPTLMSLPTRWMIRTPVFHRSTPGRVVRPIIVSPSVGGNNDDEDDDETTRGGPFYGAWLQVGDRVDALYSETETCTFVVVGCYLLSGVPHVMFVGWFVVILE